MSDNRPNLWRLQALADVQGLIKALEYDDPDIRQRAAVALRALSAFEAIPAMRNVLANEDNPDARTLITSALVHLLEEQQEESESAQPASPPDELTLLVAQLKSKDSGDIIHAAQALAALGDPLAVEPLVVLFNAMSQPANVRLAAAEALIELKSPPTVVTALVALRRPDGHLRRIAAAMLGHLEADWAVEPLKAALKDENELVRRTARAALKHIGTPEALQAADSVPEHELASHTDEEKVQAASEDKPAPLVAKSTSTPETTPAQKTVTHAATEKVDVTVSVGEPTPPQATTTPVESEPVASLVTPPINIEPTPVSATEAKPEWALEKTRPSRPEGLDTALREKLESQSDSAAVADSAPEKPDTPPANNSASPAAESAPAQSATDALTAPTAATPSSDGASPSPQTQP